MDSEGNVEDSLTGLSNMPIIMLKIDEDSDPGLYVGLKELIDHMEEGALIVTTDLIARGADDTDIEFYKLAVYPYIISLASVYNDYAPLIDAETIDISRFYEELQG